MKLEFKNHPIESIELASGRLTIGRDEANDLVIDHDEISGFHAEIHNEENGIFLVDLGSKNGTSHQGKPIKGRVELKAWDQFAIASIKAELVDPNRRRPTKAMKSVTDEDLAGSPQTERDIDKTKARPSVGGWVLIGLSEEVKGKSQPVAGKITVGRGDHCELTLPNELASREHARLELDGKRLFVEDLGSTNGTWINGKRTSGRTEVRNGDELRFDTTRFKASSSSADLDKTAARPSIQATAARSAVSAAIPARLRPDGGRAIDLKRKTTVGRLPDNDVVLDDDTVSGHHAHLEPEGAGWKVIDLGSSNGTEVNGREITEASLTGGERIAFGDVELTFEAARTGDTRDSRAVGGGAGASTGTRKQKAVSDIDRHSVATKTSQRAAARRMVFPAWAWGLVGFVLVTVTMGAWLFRDSLGFPQQQIDAPLQAGTAWRVQLGDERDRRRVLASPALADVNGDGVLDLVVADAEGHVSAFDGEEGKIIFTMSVPGRIVASLATADLTGDGRQEVVVGTNTGRVYAINGRGQIVWESEPGLGLGEITNRPAFADVNGDGKPDVIVPTSRQGLVALDGERGWKIWSTEEMTEGSVVTTPAVGDFNGDGATDFAYMTDAGQALAVSSADSRVWRLWENAEIGTVDYASPALIRVNRELLIIVATRTGVSALRADSGRMAWSNSTGGRYIASPLGVNVGERRSHDVVVIDSQGTVRLLEGSSGDEIWDLQLGRNTSASPAAFDMTGNRIPDLVLQTSDGRLVIVDSQRGRSMLEVDLSAGHAFSASPVLGDLTGDGLLEVTAVDESGRVMALSVNRRVRAGRTPWPVMLGNDQHAVGW